MGWDGEYELVRNRMGGGTMSAGRSFRLEFETRRRFGNPLDTADSRKRFIAQFLEGVHLDSDDQVVITADGIHLFDSVDAAQGLMAAFCMVTNDINEDKGAYGHDVPPMQLWAL